MIAMKEVYLSYDYESGYALSDDPSCTYDRKINIPELHFEEYKKSVRDYERWQKYIENRNKLAEEAEMMARIEEAKATHSHWAYFKK